MNIINLKHVKDYLLEVKFENGTVKIVDFEKFITNSKNPMTCQFLDIELFKKVNIEHGHLSWLNGEMDISSDSILRGDFNQE
jgi:hypothetical protein